jgi:hypothetical protein
MIDARPRELQRKLSKVRRKVTNIQDREELSEGLYTEKVEGSISFKIN